MFDEEEFKARMRAEDIPKGSAAYALSEIEGRFADIGKQMVEAIVSWAEDLEERLRSRSKLP